MVTELVLLHPVEVFVSVKVKIVLDEGLTEGLLCVLVNPLGDEVHEYVFPLTAGAPIVAEFP